jgi:rhodanese-related sulfurtransferase
LAILGLHRQLPDHVELETQRLARRRDRLVYRGDFPALHSQKINGRFIFIMKNLFSKRGFVALSMLGMLAGAGCQAQQGEPSAVPPSTVAPPARASQAPAGVQVIAAADAEKMIASDPSLQVLDVRTPEEVATGVIQGAKTINWFDADFATRAEASLDKAKPVLVYCKVGGRSAKAADVLTQKGFTKVYNLNGGITQWTAEGHPLQQ